MQVPGSPEEVWQAIATGPGVSAWFVPTEIEEREGGVITSHFGPGMDSSATITAWDPPHRFAADSPDLGPGAPTFVSEWFVEEHSAGGCAVRVIHSLVSESDAWDDQLTDVKAGWPRFFRILRLYLAHFRGERCSAFGVMGVAPEPESEAWDGFIRALGLTASAVGERCSANSAPAPLAGQVEWASEEDSPRQLLLRLDEPAPGIACLFPHAMGGQVYLTASFYLYGDEGRAAAERDEPLWQAWVNARFPLPGGAAGS